MLSENFLTMQEIPRTADHAPSRTFYLYAVNLPKISRMLLIKSYKVFILQTVLNFYTFHFSSLILF